MPTPQPEELGEAEFRVVVPLPVANWDQCYCHHTGAVQELPLFPHSHCQPRGKGGMRLWGFLGIPGVPTSADPNTQDAGLEVRQCRIIPAPEGLEKTSTTPMQPHVHHGQS